MGRFLSLSLSLISGCTVIEHRSSLIMLSTKIDSIRTQTSPPSVSPLQQRALLVHRFEPFRPAACNHADIISMQSPVSSLPPADLVRTSPRKTFPKGNAFDFRRRIMIFWIVTRSRTRRVLIIFHRLESSSSQN